MGPLKRFLLQYTTRCAAPLFSPPALLGAALTCDFFSGGYSVSAKSVLQREAWHCSDSAAIFCLLFQNKLRAARHQSVHTAPRHPLLLTHTHTHHFASPHSALWVGGRDYCMLSCTSLFCIAWISLFSLGYTEQAAASSAGSVLSLKVILQAAVEH